MKSFKKLLEDFLKDALNTKKTNDIDIGVLMEGRPKSKMNEKNIEK